MSQEAIRKALRAAPDGLSVTEIAKLIYKHRSNITVTVRSMPDVYIDRWVKAARQCNTFIPIYIAVEVPEHAPKPD